MFTQQVHAVYDTMKINGTAIVDLLLLLTSTSNLSNQHTALFPASNPTGQRERIAIVGAGIGGASAALNIHESNTNLPPQSITIFDDKFRVGGRIQSAYLYPLKGGQKTIEDGATYFSIDDWCMISATKQVGLSTRDALSWRIPDQSDDGTRTELECNAASTALKSRLRGRWKYGPSWTLLHNAVSASLRNWDSFGQIKFNRVLSELNDVGLTEDVRGLSTTYLNSLAISEVLQDDMVRPCSRGRLSEDVSEISGLSALLAAGASTRVSIDGGNSRLIERMILLSEAQVRLGSLVTAIAPGFSRRYKLSVTPHALNELTPDDDLEFDRVILAMPISINGIDLSRINLLQDTSYPTFVPSHVTHFSSTIPVSSNMSELALDVDLVKDRIFTTSAPTKTQNILNIQRAAACFRRGCVDGSECDQCDEDGYLYRIHSRQYMEDEDILQTIGLRAEQDKDLKDYGIGFVRRNAWPASFPRVTEDASGIIDEITIAPNLYYLNGAESLVSSMEMSCRMGRNVGYQVSKYGRNFKL